MPAFIDLSHVERTNNALAKKLKLSPDVPAIKDVLKEVGEFSTKGLRNRIDDLDSKGDTALHRVTVEGKAVVSRGKAAKVGPKGQLGTVIQVRRDSNDPDTTYTVRYDKQSLAKAVGELDLGKAKAAKKQPAAAGAADAAPEKSRLSPEVKLKAEVGGQLFDVVEMRFDNKQDAEKAAHLLGKLHVADALDDVPDVMTALLRQTDEGGKDVGLSKLNSNPMTEHGAPFDNLMSKDDMKFLKDHISAYEGTAGIRGRVAAEFKGKLAKVMGEDDKGKRVLRDFFDTSIEARFDETTRIRRRVELPTETTDGSVTYEAIKGQRASLKQRNSLKPFDKIGDTFTAKYDHRMEPARMTTALGMKFRIPAGSELSTLSGADRPVPEFDRLLGKNTMVDPQLFVRSRLDHESAIGEQLLTRGDIRRYDARFEINDPGQAFSAVGKLLDGEGFKEAAREIGVKVQADYYEIRKDGFDIQPGVQFKLPVAEVEGSIIFAEGLDDVTLHKQVVIDGTTKQDTPPEAMPEKVAETPKPEKDTLVVTPIRGANVRVAPAGDRVGIVQNGTFLKDSGERQIDAEGHTWMKVSGTDVADKKVDGWVRGDLLRSHSPQKGAMDETGRINPSAEYNRMDAITVVKDDNLWDLAKQHGWDFKDTLMANKDHILHPELVFAGDTIYVPGSARGPIAKTPAIEPQVAKDNIAPKDDTAVKQDESMSVRRTVHVDNDTPEVEKGVDGLHEKGGQNTKLWKPKFLNGLTEGVLKAGGKITDFITGAKHEDTIDYKLDVLKNQKMPASEVEVLDELTPTEQMRYTKITHDSERDAAAAFDKPVHYKGTIDEWKNDGHIDAYRHALWSARLTKSFGADWSVRYSAAHEMKAGNPQERKKMDLFNDNVGRKIALANPDIYDHELQKLVRNAVDNGDLMVINKEHKLTPSNQVPVGGHSLIPRTEEQQQHAAAE